ncbi:hypothetical protein H4582DRAFT_2176278 [Lactarius indigo]|nr:hypothetical protein H4582DRAFT_2176278 [Lactarius indigo]
MDIYDTVKEKAPSWATIQQQLTKEESRDHSIQGETSWISCGLKIQELQLVICYQLWSQGSKLTIEDSQVLENKCNHIQKLIDMFEHQADTFLHHHQNTDDVPVWSMGDYAEYDNVDNIDGSRHPGLGPSGHYHGASTSDGPGMESSNVEDIFC